MIPVDAQTLREVAPQFTSDFAAAQTRIIAAVGEVLIEREKAAPDPVPAVAAGKTASGWVSLRIRVEPGEKVAFGFRGNRFRANRGGPRDHV